MSVMANITPSVLQWARERAGYSEDAVVEKLKRKTVLSDTVLAWEAGKAQPTYPQLETLAKIYGIPIAVFFFPAPPAEENLKKKFRSLPEGYVDGLSPDIRHLARLATARQIDLHELHGGQSPSDIGRIRNSITGGAKELPFVASMSISIAKNARKIIGVSLDEQRQWKDTAVAFNKWRKALGDLGIWVFKESFKDDKYDGFYLHDDDDKFPVIYVDSKKAKARQIFTLFHELGHFIASKGGIHFRDNIEHRLPADYKEEEVFCNAFASAFLVPDDSLSISGVPSDDEISKYVNLYKVSREVILRKFLDRQEISEAFYSQKVREWAAQWQDSHKGDKGDKGGPNYYVRKKSNLGMKYLTVAFSQYHQHRIDEYQLLDYLGVKSDGLQSMEGYYVLGEKA